MTIEYGSEEASLVDYFRRTMAQLIVVDEEQDNPFLQLILPLTYTSRPVREAVGALAAAHLEHYAIHGDTAAAQLYGRAVQALADSISATKEHYGNDILATIILLVYYEAVCSRPFFF